MWQVSEAEEETDTASVFCAVRFHGDICGAPTVVKMIGGCVHEHTGLGAHVCQRCADILKTYEIVCQMCHDIDGHLCIVNFEESP